MWKTIVGILLVGSISSAGAAQPAAADWLPADTESSVVQQLVERLREIDLSWSDERMMSAARATVRTIRTRLEQWDEAAVLERTPSLERLDLPASGNVRLDAMLRYQVCTAVNFIRHERRAIEKRQEARIGAVAGMTAGTMVVLYLREGHIRAGGTAAQVEELLTSPKLQPVLERLQTSPDDMTAIDAECAAILGAITG